jgi:Cof subfamily protein (haloacid dehalogenase superfamily)
MAEPVGQRNQRGRVRLVALDVDGTLLARGETLTPAVIAAIARALDRGVAVTLASGRMFPLVENLVQQLALRTPIICYGGALIVDPVSRQGLYRRGVPQALAREVIQAARDRGLAPRVYLGEQVFVDRLDPDAFNFESLRRVRAQAVGDLLAYLAEDPSHLAIDAPPTYTRALVEEMRQVFQGRLNVTTGHPLLTEFSQPGVHKGSALAWLAEHLGIPPVETLAVGDDWNDIEMLRYAGLGVAVANAHPVVQAVADVVVGGSASEGVREAFERFVL